MTKLEKMDELIKKVQEDAELQKEIAAILQTEDPEDTAKADQWLAANGYQFSIRELAEHLEDGIPLSDDQLEAVAGGKGEKEKKESVKALEQTVLIVGVGSLIGALGCTAQVVSGQF